MASTKSLYLQRLAQFVLPAVKSVNWSLRRLTSACHKIQYRLEWKYGSPEWFDHYLDQFWQWGKKGTSHWLERGVFGSIAIDQGAEVLDLCCGDGFNAKHFYAAKAGKILSVDFDEVAINHARKYNAHSKINFQVADIRDAMPEGIFDNIVWDAAIEHFTEEEIASILENIKTRLRDGGVLCGFTIVERSDGKKMLDQHEYEFKDKFDLQKILDPFFDNVSVFETIHPSRHNLYFFCSNGITPFSENWHGWAGHP